ncbi:DUF6491 family protein [Aerolutibacter ruishenii]|uniref:Lipoprotein n=1 Tax=Aerolutibacter ruishenii TaxID=686800 RepID=A0A562LSY9_9GAMM|nr:DUF6491 family protein [Lysobacter ruishenii]TWI10673.1 hypothetical protein IP93_01763 [Lysobacter ruishenii]
MKRILLMAFLAAGLLSGCATNRISDAERLDIYRAHASAPVPSFRYFTSLDGWTPLGDAALAVWARPNDVYLLELSGSCPGLDFAPAISVTSQMGTVYARFDKVVVLGSNMATIPCQIREIRPVDIKAIRHAEQDRRELAQPQHQPQPSGGT